ncbi:uncharacterized protein LOC122644928 [Telopea speciosissima]|uniref:uncharacterized protein LOC122644928 n=1 Tax=Telopea speciosissima TaxID=54955 RepID=UPI001CC41905|nr:uncharacterized protein LOC122644928 [Telopea speciosissima]
MRVLSWNYQELGSPRSVRALKQISKSEKPDLFFLVETKAQETRIQVLQCQLGYAHYVAVNANGAPGGLAILWRDNIQVKIRVADDRIIDAEVVSDQGNFWITCVYGDPVRSNRHIVWNRICSYGASHSDPWMCIRDFNSFLGWHEKVGGVQRGNHDISQFWDMLDKCGLMDLGSKGPAFTWNNRRSGSTNIRIKLDRAVANAVCRLCFDNASVQIRPTFSSDYNPVLVDTIGKVYYGIWPFRFEAMWAHDPSCKSIIAQSWGS